MFRRWFQKSKKFLQRRFGPSPAAPAASLSPDAVVWAYRLFLDRDPESQAMVADKLARNKDTRQLRQEFLQADEYRQNNTSVSIPSLTGFEPPQSIEEIHDPAELHALLSHIQAAWHHLGETEPHWSVLSSEEFKQANIDNTLQNFYESGQHDVLRLIKTLERNGIDPSAIKTCLEYGCGLGRVTCWLARTFESVDAFDISRPHLHGAQDYLSSQGVENVALHQINAIADIENLPQADLVYSVIVLQHNPPPIIAIIVRQFMRSLNPGGVAYFQLPTYRLGYQFSLQQYLASDANRREIEMHCLPQSQVFEIARQESCTVLEVLEDAWTGSRYKEVSNTFLVQKK